MLFFNQNHGYLEGLVRGFKNGLLNQSEYQDCVQNHPFFVKKSVGQKSGLSLGPNKTD